MIESITFDVARTLMGLDRHIDWIAVSDSLVEVGIELYAQELQAAREYVFMVDLPRFRLNNWDDWVRQILRRLDYTEVDQSIIKRVITHLKPSVDSYYLYQDVIPLFEDLKEFEITYSALTTIPEFKLEGVMKPIRHHFHHIIHGGNAGCVKGNPKMYELDLKWKNVLPEKNLFIGDHPILDIQLPKNMGQRTIQIVREDVKPEQEGQADAEYNVISLKEVPDIISELTLS